MAEDVVVQFLIFTLRQDTPQTGVILFDGLHGRDDGPGAVLTVGQGDQVVEPGFGSQEDGVLLGKILLGRRTPLAHAGGQTGRYLVFDGQIATVGVAQEDQSHDRQKIFVAGVVGVGAQRIRRGPETPFNRVNVFELGQESGLSPQLSSPPSAHAETTANNRQSRVQQTRHFRARGNEGVRGLVISGHAGTTGPPATVHSAWVWAGQNL